MSRQTRSQSQQGQSANDERDEGPSDDCGHGDNSTPLFRRRAWTGTSSVEVSVRSKMIKVEVGEIEVFEVVAKRSWKTDKGYESSNSFGPGDLLPLAMFLQEAWKFVNNEQNRE